MPYSVLNFSKQNVGVPYNGIGVGAYIETTGTSLCPGKPPTDCIQASPCSSSSPCTPASCCLSPISQGGNQISKCNCSPVSCSTGGKCSCSAPLPPPPQPTPPPPSLLPIYSNPVAASCKGSGHGGWICTTDQIGQICKAGSSGASGDQNYVCCLSVDGTTPVWTWTPPQYVPSSSPASVACTKNGVPVVPPRKRALKTLSQPFDTCDGWDCPQNTAKGTWCAQDGGYTCCDNNKWWKNYGCNNPACGKLGSGCKYDNDCCSNICNGNCARI